MVRFRSRLRGISCVACIAVMAAMGGVGACGGAQKATWTPSPDRMTGLPTTVEALIALADEQVGQPTLTADGIDRGLAALERAAGMGGAPPFAVHWRLARGYFLLTEQVSLSGAGEGYARKGMSHGELAVTQDGERVEGHYYLALNMVKTVEASSEVEKLKPMMKVARRAADIDPAYDSAGPLRLIGKVYMVAPEWPTSVGDRDEAVDTLKKAVSLAPTPMNRLFLGQAFYHVDDFDKATVHIRRALKAPDLEKRWRDEGKDYLMRMGAFD